MERVRNRTLKLAQERRGFYADFFDYVDLPDGEFGFAVGDVAGKGAPAALLTSMMQGVFASQASSTCLPGSTMPRRNQCSPAQVASVPRHAAADRFWNVSGA